MPDIWDPDPLPIEVDELLTVAMEASLRWMAGRPPLLDSPLRRQMHGDIVHGWSQTRLAAMRARVRHA